MADPGIIEGGGGGVTQKAGPYRNFQTDKQKNLRGGEGQGPQKAMDRRNVQTDKLKKQRKTGGGGGPPPGSATGSIHYIKYSPASSLVLSWLIRRFRAPVYLTELHDVSQYLKDIAEIASELVYKVVATYPYRL